jgi:hypothetical protein
MYYIKNTEPGLWTVGHNDQNGSWHPISDHSDMEEASKQCNFLNGGHQTPKPPFSALFDEFEIETLLDAVRRYKDVIEARQRRLPDHTEDMTEKQEARWRLNSHEIENCKSILQTINENAD